MNDDNAKIKRAPGANACCDPAGRICAIAHQPLTIGRCVQIAVARGEGTDAQIRTRIEDMLASGLLIEWEG